MTDSNKTDDLKPGQHFNNYLFARSGIKEKAGNGPDVKLTLAYNYRHYDAKKWTLTPEEDRVLSFSQFVIISGSVDKGGEHDGEIKIISLRAAFDDEIPDDVTPYMKPIHQDHQEHVLRFDRLVALVTEPYLAQLLNQVFGKDKPYWTKFCEACAAEKMHHAYQGGLLHHTVEVAELCVQVCEVLPQLSRDLLVTCALLHDIGKLEEIEHGLNAGTYTATGTLNGHITSGVIMVRPFMTQKLIPGFPPKLKEAVTHMILAHHGSREFGSPQLPAFPEAYVLAECDMLSARVFQYKEAISQNKSWLPGKDGIRLYTGDLGLSKQQEPIVPAQPIPVFSTRRNSEALQTFSTTRLPIRGLVAAGSPEQSSEEDEETCEVTMQKNGADYLLKVTGDSMVDAGIFPNDLLFVKSQQTANHNEIVIAHVGKTGDVVKRLRREKHGNNGLEQDWLDSENRSANYDSIRADENTHIHGIVVGLLKA